MRDGDLKWIFYKKYNKTSKVPKYQNTIIKIKSTNNDIQYSYILNMLSTVSCTPLLQNVGGV